MEGGSIKAADKIHAMKKYKRAQFLYNLVLYSLTSLITFFFFSYHFWISLPSISISINNFIITSLSLPNAFSFVLDAKCFFVVGNLIVLILIGQSKLARSSSCSSPALDMYNEYVARSQSGYRKPAHSYAHSKDHKVDNRLKLQSMKIEEKRGENVVEINHVSCEDMKKKILDKKKDIMGLNKIEGCGGEGEIVKEGQIQIGNMHREELNKRVEAFIARVNKKRVLEAKFVDQCIG